MTSWSFFLHQRKLLYCMGDSILLENREDHSFKFYDTCERMRTQFQFALIPMLILKYQSIFIVFKVRGFSKQLTV